MTLAETIDKYINRSHRGHAYSLGDEIAVIVNPSFAILPSQPHHSPLMVAVYCQRGKGTGRVNTRTYNIEAGGLFIVLPGQITELVKLSKDFEANYREHRDLKFYAERMGLTPKYISTVVKTSSKRSAMEWIERYVTLDAIAQLTSTDRSIKYIAYDLNFPSLSFFGKYFKRIVGLSPSVYRTKHKKQQSAVEYQPTPAAQKGQIKYDRRIAKREQ